MNVGLTMVGGALLTLADTLINPILILPIFVSQLTASLPLVGLAAAIAGAGYWLPQPLAHLLIRSSRRKLGWVIGASIVRATAIALLAFVVSQPEDVNPQRLLRAFFICYTAYVLASGLARVAAMGLESRAIPPGRRGVAVVGRNVGGAVLAIVAGLVVGRMLGEEGRAFPRNFGLVFVASAAILGAVALFWAGVREPGRLALAPSRVGPSLRRQVIGALADPNLRRYLGFRVPVALLAAADPFWIIYANREFGVPLRYASFYLVVYVVARLVASVAWTALARRRGQRAVLQAVAFLRLLIPVIAVMLPFVIDTPWYQDRFGADLIAVQWAFGGVFALAGAALAGQILGNHAYVMEIAPAARRPVYLGLVNASLALAACGPILTGALIDRADGFSPVFYGLIVLGAIAILLSGRLTDTNLHPRLLPNAWNLRRARL